MAIMCFKYSDLLAACTDVVVYSCGEIRVYSQATPSQPFTAGDL